MTDLEGWRTREGFIVAMAMVAMVVGVEEEVAEVIGPGINQMLGIRAREGYEGSVLEAARPGGQ